METTTLIFKCVCTNTHKYNVEVSVEIKLRFLERHLLNGRKSIPTDFHKTLNIFLIFCTTVSIIFI